jgi:glutamine amidotransferase
MKVGVLDYGCGNIKSIFNALKAIGHQPVTVSSCQDIEELGKLILPGVGAFGPAMQKLESSGAADALREFHLRERGLVGICLGMQLMATTSEENGDYEGLNLIPGHVSKIPVTDQASMKLPMIAWRQLQGTEGGQSGPIIRGFFGESFYFVHSYQFRSKCPDHVQAIYRSGANSPVTALIGDGLNYGCQFHPERSGVVGLQLLKSLIEC